MKSIKVDGVMFVVSDEMAHVYEDLLARGYVLRSVDRKITLGGFDEYRTREDAFAVIQNSLNEYWLSLEDPPSWEETLKQLRKEADRVYSPHGGNRAQRRARKRQK